MAVHVSSKTKENAELNCNCEERPPNWSENSAIYWPDSTIEAKLKLLKIVKWQIAVYYCGGQWQQQSTHCESLLTLHLLVLNDFKRPLHNIMVFCYTVGFVHVCKFHCVTWPKNWILSSYSHFHWSSLFYIHISQLPSNCILLTWTTSQIKSTNSFSVLPA